MLTDALSPCGCLRLLAALLLLLLATPAPPACGQVADLLRQKEEEKNPLSKYDYVGFFSDDDIAVAGKDGYYGLVNGQGDVVAPFLYSELTPATDGLYFGRKGGKLGCLSASGVEVVPFVYDRLSRFTGGIAFAFRGGKYGYVDENGREVVPCVYDRIEPFSDGYAVVVRDGRWGAIDRSGTEVLACRYDSLGAVSAAGRVWVKAAGKYGLVDLRQDLQLLAVRYVEAYSFNPDGTRRAVDFSATPESGLRPLTYISDGASWGIVDENGRVVAPCSWQHIGPFSHGFAWAVAQGKVGIIDTAGVERQSCRFERVAAARPGGPVRPVDPLSEPFPAADALLYVSAGGKTGVLRPDASPFVPVSYDSIGVFADSMVVVRLSGRYGYLDAAGQPVITCTYRSATDFSEGVAAVEREGEKGFFFIDRTGEELFRERADSVGLFADGLCPVRKGDSRYYIDRRGKKVKNPEEYRKKQRADVAGEEQEAAEEEKKAAEKKRKEEERAARRQERRQRLVEGLLEGSARRAAVRQSRPAVRVIRRPAGRPPRR